MDAVPVEMIDELLGGTTFRLIRCALTQTDRAMEYSVNSPFSRLVLMHRGGGRYRFAGQEIHLRVGELLLVPTNMELACRFPARMSTYFAYFRADYAGASDLMGLLRPARYAVRLPGADGLFARMIERFGANDGPGRVEATACLLQLLAPFVAGGATSDRSLAQRRRVQPALEHIDRHIGRPLSVGELAAAAGLSPKSFCNVFSKVMGCGPLAYATGRRLQAAKEQLLRTDLPLKTIAAHVGYHDPLYFSRVFRKCTGVSPRQYRAGREHEFSPADRQRGTS